MDLKSILQDCDACDDAIAWVADRTPIQAWQECRRGDWLLWIAARAGIDDRVLTRAKVGCAKLVEHLMQDPRSVNALRVAERYADGQASRQELSAAYADAAAATYAADAATHAATAAADAATAANTAAYAAAYAAYAAHAAAYAAYAAAYAAYAAYAAAAAANAAAADAYDIHSKILARCADIVRHYINFDDVIKGL